MKKYSGFEFWTSSKDRLSGKRCQQAELTINCWRYPSLRLAKCAQVIINSFLQAYSIQWSKCLPATSYQQGMGLHHAARGLQQPRNSIPSGNFLLLTLYNLLRNRRNRAKYLDDGCGPIRWFRAQRESTEALQHLLWDPLLQHLPHLHPGKRRPVSRLWTSNGRSCHLHHGLPAWDTLLQAQGAIRKSIYEDGQRLPFPVIRKNFMRVINLEECARAGKSRIKHTTSLRSIHDIPLS